MLRKSNSTLTECLSIQPHKALFLIFESKEKWATYLVSFFSRRKLFLCSSADGFNIYGLAVKVRRLLHWCSEGLGKCREKYARKPFGKRFWLAVFLYASRVEELPSFVKYCLKRKNIHCQAVCAAYVWQPSAEG